MIKMKYRTKEKLPLVKVGTEVEIFSKGCVPIAIYNGVKDISISEEYIPILLKEGWIEEIRPREFEIHLDADGFFQAFINNGYSYVATYSKSPFIPKPIQIIKVRDVLE